MIFDFLWKPETLLKNLEEHRSHVLALIKEIKQLSSKALEEVAAGNYNEVSAQLTALKGLDEQIVDDEKDPEARAEAVRILKECVEVLETSKKTNLANILQNINQLVNHLESRETALIITDKQVCADFMSLMQKKLLPDSDIDDFEKTHRNFLSAKPNKKLGKIIMKRLRGKTIAAIDYNSAIADTAIKIVEELVSGRCNPEVMRKSSDKDREENELRYYASILAKKYSKDPALVLSDLSRAIHKSKGAQGRHGR